MKRRKESRSAAEILVGKISPRICAKVVEAGSRAARDRESTSHKEGTSLV